MTFDAGRVHHGVVRTHIDVPERRMRFAIAGLVPTFALIGMFAALSDEGPVRPADLIVAAAVMMTTLPMCFAASRFRLGEVWWDRRAARRSALVAGVLFALYADLGVAVVLFTFTDREFAMYGTALFAVISAYVAHFAGRGANLAHVGFTSVGDRGAGPADLAAGRARRCERGRACSDVTSGRQRDGTSAQRFLDRNAEVVSSAVRGCEPGSTDRAVQSSRFRTVGVHRG
ncbi:hypothetical protein [Rhodococcus sp. 27YEA15]|uniref:hypothetical protein n=1 Tax=Rhodococcus sp. 27YEA15 TaxID=3156259 RepID=UPI003C79EA8F